MKRQWDRVIMVILLAWLPGVALAEAEQATSESYYQQLRSLVTRRNVFRVRPQASERDINLIEVEKGAAGVLFGPPGQRH